jgi:hypothetical protein
MGEALRVAGDLGRDPVHHGAASPSTQTVNPKRLISTQFATEPEIGGFENRDPCGIYGIDPARGRSLASFCR